MLLGELKKKLVGANGANISRRASKEPTASEAAGTEKGTFNRSFPSIFLFQKFSCILCLGNLQFISLRFALFSQRRVVFVQSMKENKKHVLI
jgi:hypothetical protein